MLNKADVLTDMELQSVERQFKRICQHTRIFSISALMKQRTDELVSSRMRRHFVHITGDGMLFFATRVGQTCVLVLR